MEPGKHPKDTTVDMFPETKVTPPEEAKPVIDPEELKKQQECLGKVMKVLEEYGYDFTISNSIGLTKRNG